MPLYPAEDLYPGDNLYPDTAPGEEPEPERDPHVIAAEWLAMLPPVLRDDPWIQAIFHALAHEMYNLIEQAQVMAEGLIPTTANFYTMKMWEALLGLPMEPVGLDTEQRHAQVMSRLLRNDGSGSQWERNLAAATGNTSRYTEHDSGDPVAPWYTVAIDTALPPGITIQALREYIRGITPANLHLEVAGGQTYRQARDDRGHADYEAARDGYVDYDNMRFWIA